MSILTPNKQKQSEQTFTGYPYSKLVLELVHDSNTENSHRAFEANHAIILEDQKMIRK